MAPSQVDGAHAAVSNPLRGRDNELASLHDHLARLRSGAGTSWLIEGGPGLGKSRLVEHASLAAQRCGFAVGHGVAEPGDAAVELAVLMDALFGGPEPLLEIVDSQLKGGELLPLETTIDLVEVAMGLAEVAVKLLTETVEPAVYAGELTGQELYELLVFGRLHRVSPISHR